MSRRRRWVSSSLMLPTADGVGIYKCSLYERRRRWSSSSSLLPIANGMGFYLKLHDHEYFVVLSAFIIFICCRAVESAAVIVVVDLYRRWRRCLFVARSRSRNSSSIAIVVVVDDPRLHRHCLERRRRRTLPNGVGINLVTRAIAIVIAPGLHPFAAMQSNS